MILLVHASLHVDCASRQQLAQVQPRQLHVTPKIVALRESVARLRQVVEGHRVIARPVLAMLLVHRLDLVQRTLLAVLALHGLL